MELKFAVCPQRQLKPLLYCCWQKWSWNHGIWYSGHSKQTALFNSIRRNWTLLFRDEHKTEIKNKILMDFDRWDLTKTIHFFTFIYPHYLLVFFSSHYKIILFAHTWFIFFKLFSDTIRTNSDVIFTNHEYDNYIFKNTTKEFSLT